MRPPPSSKAPLLVLLLASAAGLVVLGILGMGSALRVAEERAQNEGRRAAAVRAEAARRALARAEVLEHCEEGERFKLVRGRAVLRGTPEAVPMAEGSVTFVRLRALEAQRKEFVQGDAAAARALLQKSEATPGLGASARGALLLRRAWLERRNELRDDASVRVAQLVQQTICDADLASAIWFVASAREDRGVEILDWLARVSALEPEQREALARLAPRASTPALAEHLRAARVRAARQAVLEAATWLVEGNGAQARFEGEQLVFRVDGASAGAILPIERVAQVLDAATPGSESRITRGELVLPGGDVDENGAASVPIWPGLALRVSESQQPRSWWSAPRWQPALLLAVAALFSLLLWAYLRSVRTEREALALRGDFLRSVSHELRTPLTSIRMLAETLETGRVTSDEKRSEYHRLMAGEAARLGALVENVLDLGRIERGERRYVLEAMRLDELVRQCCELFAPLARRAGLELRVDATPIVVLGERDALQQAILNLLDNAAKYASGGDFVELRLAREGALAVLRVQDDGPGVSEAERAAIFERFRRGSRQRDGAIPGAGIGLAIARSIAMSHGGALELVASAKGACFELRVPRALPEDDELSNADKSGRSGV